MSSGRQCSNALSGCLQAQGGAMKHIMSPSGIHLPNKHSGHLHIQCESRSESGAQPKQFWDMSQPPQRRSILSCNALSARHAWTAATHKLVAMPICHVLGIGSPPAPAPVPLQHSSECVTCQTCHAWCRATCFKLCFKYRVV